MVRIWKVPVEWLCKQHLVGIHNEIHKLIGEIENERENVIQGRLDKNQIVLNPVKLKLIHDSCVDRLDNHNSEFPDKRKLKNKINKMSLITVSDDQRSTIKDLTDMMGRCEDCRENILEGLKERADKYE